MAKCNQLTVTPLPFKGLSPCRTFHVVVVGRGTAENMPYNYHRQIDWYVERLHRRRKSPCVRGIRPTVSLVVRQ